MPRGGHIFFFSFYISGLGSDITRLHLRDGRPRGGAGPRDSLMRYVFYILILTLSMTCKLCMQIYPNPFSHVILRICKIVHARAHSKGRRGHITHLPPPRRPYPAYSTHGENLFLSFTILNINDAGTCYLGDD